jgi:hypothetical protein
MGSGDFIRKIMGGRAPRAASRREAMTSVTVIAALVVVGAGVLLKQGSFNEAVNESLKVAAGVAGAGVGKKSGDIITELPVGLAVMSPAESFDRETLSDKINGRAELYLPAGFVGLRAQRLRFKDNREIWFELFIYDMGSARGAFSVYSTQRRESAPAVKYAKHGYRTANAVCFVRGNDYVEVVASGTGAKVTEVMSALGRKLAAAGKPADGDDSLGESALFPKEGLVAGSVQLIAKNAFSFGRFDDIFSARYLDGGTSVTLFLSRRKSAGAAKDLAAAYRKFLIELDGREAPAPANAWLVDMDGSFEGAFSSGRILGGVHQVDDAAVAGKWLARLEAAVKEKKR